MLNKLKQLNYRYYIGIVVIAIAIVFGLIFILRSPQSAEAEWFNDAWYYRQQFDIYNNEASALIDFQVAIPISTLQLDSLSSTGKINSDFSDLRFTDSNGNLLDYWFEDDTDTMYRVYVKFPNLPADTTFTMFMYYGNSSASDNRARGDNFFEFFDDFSGSSLDTDKWIKHYEGDGDGTINVANGELTITCNYGTDTRDNIGIHARQALMSEGYVIEAKSKITSGRHASLISAGDGLSWNPYPHAEDMQGISIYGRFDNHTSTYSYNDGYNHGYGNINPGDPKDYAHYEIKWISSSALKFYKNEILQEDLNSNIPNGNLYPYFSNDAWYYINSAGDDTTYIDHVLVRKITATEPTITLSSTPEEKGPSPVGYWSFDEGYGTTTQDKTSNDNDGTITGATWQTEDQCIAGKCLYFDGSDAKVNVVNDQSIAPEEITVSLWVKANFSSEIRDVLKKYSPIDYWILIDTNNKVRFYTGGTSDINAAFSTTSIQQNKWYFVTGVNDGINTKIYINGNYEGSANSPITPGQGSANLTIGEGYSDPRYFKGFIDEVKVYPYARTEAQIKADYNAGLAGLSSNSGINVAMGGKSNKYLSDGLVAYWKMDEASWNGTAGEVTDSSGNGNHATSYNGAITTSIAKYGMAGEFDGLNDGVSSSNHYGFDSMINISFSLWFRGSIQGGGTFKRLLIGQLDSTNYFQVTGSSVNNFVQVGFTREGVLNMVATNNVIDSSSWNHVVGIYDGNEVKFYLNNVLQSGSTIGGQAADSTNGFKIGKRFNSDVSTFGGQIDEVRIYNRVLSDQEVKQLYEYAPSPVAYWDFEEKQGTIAYDKSGNENNGTLTNMDNNDWVLGKYGSALDFDGDNDYVDLGPTNSLLPEGTSNFTLSSWVKSSDNGLGSNGWAVFAGTRYGVDVQIGRYSSSNYAGVLVATSPSGNLNAPFATSDIFDQDWHYISYTFNNGIGSIYVDGILEGTDSTREGESLHAGSNIFGIGGDPGGRNFFGQIDEVKIYNYVRTQKQILEDMNGGQSAINSPIGYWSFDEGYGSTAHDTGLGGNDGTITGASWTSNGKFGKALDFNGSSDYVTMGNAPNTEVSGSVSISAWVKPNSLLPEWDIIAGRGEANNEQYDLRTKSTNGSLIFLVRDSANYYIADSGITSTGQWIHLVGVYDSSIKKAKIYANGEFKDSVLTSDSTLNTGANYFTIGGRYYSGSWRSFFNGLIDEVKVWNYALNEDEVRQEYNQGKVVVMGSEKNSNSTWDDGGFGGDAPVAYYNFEEGSGTTANDISGNGNVGTLNGMDNDNWILGKESSWALDFNGVNDHIIIPDNSIIEPVTMTLEAWFKTSDKNANGRIVSKTQGGAYQLSLNENSACGNNKLCFLVYISGIGYRPAVWDVSNLNDNQWYHVVGTYDGSDVKLYVDGLLKDTNNQTGTIFQVSSPLCIGAEAGSSLCNGGVYFNGQIDEVKIYDYARTPAQIAYDYNKGKPVAYWSLDDGEGITANDSSGNGNDGILISMDPVTNWLDGSDCKFEGCLDFNGTDDFISIAGSNNELDSLFSEITISTWIKTPDATPSSQHGIVSKGTTSGSNNFDLNLEINGKIRFWFGPTNFAYSSQSISDNNWHHVVGIWDGSQTQVYVDGIPGEATNNSFSISQSGSPILLGSWNQSAGWWFEGSIDDVRIYNYALSEDQIKEVYNGGLVKFK